MQETLQLTVGYHRLEGKLVALKKPLAILRRPEEGASAYEVVGVVRAKYHFKNRPRALISAPEAAKRSKAGGTDTAAATALLFGRRS